jgi:hypothetical protein
MPIFVDGVSAGDIDQPLDESAFAYLAEELDL